MKLDFRLVGLGAVLASGLAGAALAQPAAPPAGAPSPIIPMVLTSSSFTDGGILPDKYSQNSKTPVSPALAWDGAPPETATFTLILHDTDGAPRKGSADVLHWMAFNIPGTARSLPEGVPAGAQLPDGTVQPANSMRNNGFTGPGARIFHHYVFELYALDTKLSLDANATRPDVLAAMDGHVLAKAAIEVRFHR